MDRLRAQGPTGRVGATSADGSSIATASRAAFGVRIDDFLRMADGSVGKLIGAVVFVQNEAGEQVRAYWLEPALGTSGE
jgi:hypothetical protein